MNTGSLQPRELAVRESDGVRVVLRWHPHDDAVTVSVGDARVGDCFQLAIAPDRALDAFYHPFAYRHEGPTTSSKEERACLT
jgi:hypothetical protein